MSEFEDEDVSVEQVYSRLDENRLFGIKSLVFNIFRDKIGQDLLNLADFITILNEISSTYEGKTFSSVLFDWNEKNRLLILLLILWIDCT